MTNLDVIGKLQSLITDGDEVDRCYAIQSLVAMQYTGANELLVQCLRDEDIDVCIDAANALAELGDHDVSGKLIESLLNDPDGEVKTACIRTLSNLRERDAIPHLLKIIEHRPEDISFNSNDWDFWWDMQLECIKGVGYMQVSDAVPVLQRMLETEDYLDIEEQIFSSLAQIGSEGDTLLIKLLETGDVRTRRRVVKALASSQSNSTLKPLARALRDSDADVRTATLNSLAQRQQAIHYLPIILHLFNDNNSEVRSTAIKVAQRLSEQLHENSEGDYSALFEKLLPMLGDSDPAVKTMVLETLSKLNWQPDRKIASQIIQLLSKSKGDCFGAVCRFIGKYQLEEAIDDIILLCKRGEMGIEEKCRALSTLGHLQHWNEDIEILMGAAIYAEEKNIRLAALEALATLDEHHPGNDETEQSDERLPFDMIKEALRGQLAPPASMRDIPVIIGDNTQTSKLVQEAEPHTKAAEVQIEDSASEEGDDFVAKAMDEIAQSINAGETPVPMSTLDSMVVSCVEKKLEEQAQQEATEEAKPQELSDEEKAELKTFLDITKANSETAKWLFNKEVVPVQLDIQRLAARILGSIGSTRMIPALLGVLDQSDSELKREAILSIGRLLGKDALADDLVNSIRAALLESINDENRDLRIAAIRVLGDIGIEQDLAVLTGKLEDKETSVRIHSVHALSKLANRSDINSIRAIIEVLQELLGSNEIGVHRAVVDAMIPLFSGLNGSADSLKQSAIEHIIQAGLAGSDGQVKEMSRGLGELDINRASTSLLKKLDALDTSVERRYVVEMLGELHKPRSLH